MKPSAFSLLHPTIQNKLYQMNWTNLRPIQIDAIFAVFESTNHLVISANTAAGKTEAAFLPILSKIVDNQDMGIGAIYVGPLKALINDQFQRLERLCDLSGIPVFKWHGDISSDKKKKFLKNPRGVLLITPESIESLFINHSDDLSHLFSGLSYIVIDEMHSFIGIERGAHLRSLISRATAFSFAPVRIVGLSATFGDTNLVKQWLMPNNPESVEIIDDPNNDRNIRYLIKGYLLGIEDPKVRSEEEVNNSSQDISNDLIKYFYRHSSLVFINSRESLEEMTDLVRRKLEREGKPDFFRIHHGSLSKTEREDAELQLKTNSLTSCFTSSTLEMGIDVGNISRIGQVGAPWSVNSLVQRLGRSGRGEGESSEMIMFITEYESDDLIKRLFPDLIQAIAMSELMFERWYEPSNSDYKYYSTFVQQILSVIKEKGGINLLHLFEILIKKGTFTFLTKEEFISILRTMKESDLIEQTPDGLLILGLEGEMIVKSMEFYAVFQTTSEFDVIHHGRKIGSIPYTPGLEVRKYLILAGKRWEIESIDFKKKEILVIPSRAAKVPKFKGASFSDIHPRIREKMRDILLSNQKIPYLDRKGREMLQMARNAAQNASLLSKNYVVDGKDIFWFTWTGTAKNRTLAKIGAQYGGFDIEDCEIALKFSGAKIENVIKFFSGIEENMPSLLEIAQNIGNLEHEKYDRFVPEDLLAYAYATKYLDSDIKKIIDNLVA
ncbi:DEAD/DEAH box helicase [Methanosphaerula subterraneus]|uniref:DEAD/DEAH box helicase n=1 Tax=Methanosphaerula subterraneus TaxID=3350244 RepID=UPI003F860782